MHKVWPLQDAKNRLSELVENAVNEGPQRISKRGKTTVVVLAIDEYDRLRRGKESLVEFFRRSPLQDVPLERDKDLPREVDL